MRLHVWALIAAATALAGCSSTHGATNQADVASMHSSGLATPGQVTSTTQAANTSPRGMLVKKLGEPAGIIASTGAHPIVLTFTVDKIQVDPKCTGSTAEKPENGHFIAVSMTVKTTSDFAPDSFQSIDDTAFTIVGSDGITDAGVSSYNAFECLKQSEQLPINYLPGSQYQGTVVLDSKYASGVLVYPMRMSNAQGWEWSF